MIKQRLPNYLTYFRIAVIPAVIVCFYIRGEAGYLLCAGLFLLAGITDWLDGHLARIWAVESNIGRFLDPIADKLLVATSLMLLVNADRVHILPAIAIVSREILVSGLREFLAEIHVSVPVSKLAKWKTAAQMVAIFLLLLGPVGLLGLPTQQLGTLLLWLAAALTLVTGYAYLKTGMRYLG